MASVLETLQVSLKGACSQEGKKSELWRLRAPFRRTDSRERETPVRKKSIDGSRLAGDLYDGVGCKDPVVSITYN